MHPWGGVELRVTGVASLPCLSGCRGQGVCFKAPPLLAFVCGKVQVAHPSGLPACAPHIPHALLGNPVGGVSVCGCVVVVDGCGFVQSVVSDGRNTIQRVLTSLPYIPRVFLGSFDVGVYPCVGVEL